MARLFALALISVATAAPAFAQTPADITAKNYPDRTIRILVPFPPGGPADLIARFVGQKMSEDFGQPL